MAHQLLASTTINKNNNNTNKFLSTDMNDEDEELEENKDNTILHSPLTAKPSSISISEQQHNTYKNQSKKPIHASQNKFMMLMMDESMMTEDNTKEHQRRQRHHRRSSSRYHKQQRTLPLDIPVSPSSSSFLSSSSILYHPTVTHVQKTTTKPVLSATCPVNNSSHHHNKFKLAKQDMAFTVGSMPEQESPVPWPSQILDHVSTPDGMAQLSDYISSSTTTINMMDDTPPLLFNMED